MGVSVYDMDRTITRGGTFTPWLLFWARREAPWRLLLLPALGLVLAAYGLKLIERGRLKELSHLLMMGGRIPAARLRPVAEAFAEQVLAGDVFPAALAQMAADRAAGERLVIATASNDYYVQAVAARLGVEDVVATASSWVEDNLGHRLGGGNCYGAEKRLLVEGWLARHGLMDARINFYSDHLSDLPMFELAQASGGEAVAANPSAALRAEAEHRGWRVVDWGEQRRSFFERA